MHLLEQVTLALAGQFREVRRRAVAIRTVTGAAHRGFRLARGGIASGMGKAGQTQGQQQTHEKFVHQLIQLRLRVKIVGFGYFFTIHWMVAW